MLNFEPEKYKLDKISHAPECIGIYAWYACLDMRAPDWSCNTDETGEDLANQRTRDIVNNHSKKYQPLEFDLIGKSNFNQKWVGNLSPQLSSFFDENLNQNDRTESTFLSDTFSTEKTRKHLAHLLKSSMPIFASPLYIGKSNNIRSRLQSHASTLKQIYNIIKDDDPRKEEIIERIKQDGANFGARAIAAGFTPDDLFVYVINIESICAAGMKRKEIEKICSSYEWLLNRWHRPLLGRL